MTHLSITQSSVIALVNQIIAFIAGFGIIDSTETGLVIAASAAVVNAAFLIANAVHHYATASLAASTNK